MNSKDYPFVFSLDTLEKIARVAGEPVPPDLADQASKPKTTERRPRQIDVANFSPLPESLRSPANATKAESVVIPGRLQADETVFAFRNPDGSLGDWFPTRALMFATKARDPMSGDLVMVTGKDGRTRVRLLLEITEAGLSLSKTMPAVEDETVPFDDIGDIAIVVEVIRD